MKLRIKGNSIRIRLSRSEVREFSETGQLSEKTCFPEGAFSYAVRTHPGRMELFALLQPGSIVMEVPADFAATWYDTDTVGLRSVILSSDGNELHLLIEKDFICLDDTDEDQSDNYLNPKANC